MTWVAIVAVGLGSFAFRLGPLILFQRISLSERANRLLRQGGMSAIVALIVVSTRNEATGNVAVPTILAVAAGTVLAARGASMLRLLVWGGGVYASSLVVAALFVH
jgi:branched-subunit amino acid transport protein